MKTKDLILVSLVALNLMLVVFVLSVYVVGQPAPAPASNNQTVNSFLNSQAFASSGLDRNGYFRTCPVTIAEGRDGLAVIDTLTNRMVFYVPVAGKDMFEKMGPTFDLAKNFQRAK